MAVHDPRDATDAAELEQLRRAARRIAALLVAVATAAVALGIAGAATGILGPWIGAGLTIGAAMQVTCGLWWWHQVGPPPQPANA